jgi:hypothetical protein
MPPAIKAWSLAEEWPSEPRGPDAPLLGRPATALEGSEAA